MFVSRKLQEKYQDKGKKLHVCFVDMEKAFDRVPRKSGGMDIEEDGNTKRFG